MLEVQDIKMQGVVRTITRQAAAEAQKKESERAATELHQQIKTRAAVFPWDRVVRNAIYRTLGIWDEGITRWLFVGEITVRHLVTGYEVPLSQLELRVKELDSSLQYYVAEQSVMITSQEKRQSSTGQHGDALVRPKQEESQQDKKQEIHSRSCLKKRQGTEIKLRMVLVPEEEKRSPQRLGRSEGSVRVSSLRGYIPQKQEIYSESCLKKQRGSGMKLEAVMVPKEEKQSLRVRLGQSEGLVRVSALKGAVPQKLIETRHYPPLLHDEEVRVKTPDYVEEGVKSLSIASYNMPRLFVAEENQEWTYACVERTHKDLDDQGVLKYHVLTQTGIYLKGSPVPKDLLLAYFEEGSFKLNTNRLLLWRGIKWNDQPYQYNELRTKWKLDKASRFMYGLTKVSHMGHDPTAKNLLEKDGRTYFPWWTWQKMSSSEVLLCFHSIHHAGFHSLPLIDREGPSLLVIQEHGSQLSKETFEKEHVQYGDDPRYLAHIGTPALRRGFRNYVLIYEEEREKKDLFLVYIRKKEKMKGLLYRGDDPGEGWIRQATSWFRKLTYEGMRKVVEELVRKGKPFQVAVG